MPTAIQIATVKDKQHWLTSSKREEVLGPLGVTNMRTFVNPDNPTQVALVADIADLPGLMAAAQSSKELADAMEYDGVLPGSTITFVES
jgi:hypothetical protein